MPGETISPSFEAFATACLSALMLTACAGYAPRASVGEMLAAVEARNGAPTGRYAWPDAGSRIEYARGPSGKHTWMIDADGAGRVIAVRQVLTEAEFGKIVAGMTAEELLQRVGRPSERHPGGWQGGEFWAYRYDAIFCQWFVVGMTPAGVVRDTGFAPDPMCDDGGRGDGR